MAWLKGAVLLTATVLGAQPALAQAQDDGRGGYVSLRLGAASLSNTDIDYADDGGTFGGTGTVDTLRTRADVADAFAFGGAAGYDLGTARIDLEVDYSRSRFDGLQIRSVNGAAVTTISPADAADFCDYAEVTNCSVSGNTIRFKGGRVRQLSGLLNVWVDLPAGKAITPYVGGGLGIGGFETGGEGKARFAWQAGAGVAVALSPHVALTADYRFRQISGATFTDEGYPDYSLRVGKLKTHSLLAGLRFTF